MLTSSLDEGVAQQALVLTATAWAGMLLLTFHSERLYRRWPALAIPAALLTVASIVAWIVLLGMMTYSDTALAGGASIVVGALALRAVSALRRRAGRTDAVPAAPWRRAAKHRVRVG